MPTELTFGDSMQENKDKSISSIRFKQFTPKAADVGQFKVMAFTEENVASNIS